MKTSADFQEACDTTKNFGTARGWLGDSRKDFQQRAFAGAVATDDADDFAGLHLEGDVFQSPDDVSEGIRGRRTEGRGRFSRRRRERGGERGGWGGGGGGGGGEGC